MRVKITVFALFIASLILLSSCAYKPVNEQRPLLFIVGEPQDTTFVIGGENPLAWFEETGKSRQELNTIRYNNEDKDEQEEFEIKTRLRNVRRLVDSEMIIGFDKELDNPDFKEVS